MTETETGELRREVERRRTFAIISHPDAGKTTLTEKLLLYGGAIRLAGAVKARKSGRHAVSDWMEIEKQRGISVTSSAMQFQYGDKLINILDTPGHQDFSEDTYRTLMAADSAVMLIDGAKGVEEQTIKLFRVCRQRGIPIFTFVNKMDRASLDPFELMEQLEAVLGIRACPVNWPIGIHGDFLGVYHRGAHAVELYSSADHGASAALRRSLPADSPELGELLAPYLAERLSEDIELLDGAGDGMDLYKVLGGELTPMFFGSAINNFGVETFLDTFLQMTQPPAGRMSDIGLIEPADPRFTGFVFKIQANMNPAHRDRIAFMRVCSGVFERGMTVLQAQTEKTIKLAQAQQLMAQDRSSVERAYPGDIVGLFDPGVFRLGDTLTDGARLQYEGMPMFMPEHFARVTAVDSMKRKQFIKGVAQLSEEGVIQTFRREDIGREEILVGVVGALQFEVLEHRLRGEYGVEARIERTGFRFVRWIGESDGGALHLTSTTLAARDSAGQSVLLFENEWSIRWALENNPALKLCDTSARR